MKVKVERNPKKARWDKMPSVQEQLDAIWDLLPKSGQPGPPEAEAIRAAVTNLKDRFKPAKP